MALLRDPLVEHLLRRAGFGARPDEINTYGRLGLRNQVDRLVDYERIPDNVDARIGQPGYVGITSRGAFLPNTVIADARQRWLFRMVHTERPLQEKMALFWHNHFATGYAKLVGALGSAEATRYMAAKPSEDPASVRGQIELFRDCALGNFRDLLVAVARDAAMLVWLDGASNTRQRPQENFGREIMELFTLGVGNYTEADVYAAARVFTGWNLTRLGQGPRQFVYVPGAHDTEAKTFTFSIYRDGRTTIPSRSAAEGMQDGIDFIDALATSPATARRLATKLYRFFVSEFGEVSDAFVERIATIYLQNGTEMKPVMRAVLMSPEFWERRNYFTRYAWPVEFVVRTLKDVGWNGFSVNDALPALSNMGQNLFDPPDVNGWEQGELWFSTGSMLARMNFASQLAANQQFKLRDAAAAYGSSPDALLAWVLESLRTPELQPAVRGELLNYLTATGPWTGSATQLQSKVAGLVHLVAATPEYQFI